MAKELPYFRFTVSEWLNDDISMEDYKTKGVFADVCAFYWFRDCSVDVALLEKRFVDALTTIQSLVEINIIKYNNKGQVSINFLDIQFDLLSEKRKKYADAGRKGGLSKSSNAKATLKPGSSYKDKDKDKENNKDKDNLFKPDFENFISACFKYLGKPYTQGNPEMHGIEAPIRKWLLTHDANIQLLNLNAYVTVTPDKQFRAKTIEKLLEKLEGYNFCQDLKTYSPAGNGLQQKTQEELDGEKKETLEIKEGYKRIKLEADKAREEQESDGDFEKLKSDIGK